MQYHQASSARLSLCVTCQIHWIYNLPSQDGCDALTTIKSISTTCSPPLSILCKVTDHFSFKTRSPCTPPLYKNLGASTDKSHGLIKVKSLSHTMRQREDWLLTRQFRSLVLTNDPYLNFLTWLYIIHMELPLPYCLGPAKWWNQLEVESWMNPKVISKAVSGFVSQSSIYQFLSCHSSL